MSTTPGSTKTKSKTFQKGEDFGVMMDCHTGSSHVCEVYSGLYVKYAHHKLKNIHWLPLWWICGAMMWTGSYLWEKGSKLNMYLISKLK